MSDKGILQYLSLPQTPKTAHLAIKLAGDKVLPVPLGGHMLIVQFDGEQQLAEPVILTHASFRELRFRCGCARHNCTREVTFRGHYTGRHPSLEQA